MTTFRNLFVAIILLASIITSAQPPQDRMEERKEEIEAMKIGFLTKRLDLSPEEAKTFWPVYNQFQNELVKLRKSRRNERKEARDEFDNMTDKDVEKLVDGEIAYRQQELDVMKKYHGQFKQVLPVKKVALLYRTEEEFKRELLQRLQDRKRDMPDKRRQGFK